MGKQINEREIVLEILMEITENGACLLYTSDAADE